MVAKSGDKLLADAAVEGLREKLLPVAGIITPNMPEAGVLLGWSEDEVAADPQAAGQALLRLGAKAVLLKGGHGKGPDSTDLLMSGDSIIELTGPRIPTRNTHGTGCTLSSAIAAGLAKGMDVTSAVRVGKAYIEAAILGADSLDIGRGHGPVHHFHAFWKAGG
ncbi:MAG: PfkB family carbohydrate kinase, partial [Rhodospirillales bacterium]